MQIVLISGKQGSGKTTTSKALGVELFQKFNKKVEHIKFAGVIYEIEEFARNTLARYGIIRNLVKDGPLLQLLGTQWGRDTIDKDIWAKIVRNRCVQAKAKGVDVVIIDDCRFENEFDLFPDALKVRLECQKEIRKTRAEMWRENDAHASEIGLDKYLEQKKFNIVLWTDSDTMTPRKVVETLIESLQVSTQHADNL